MPSMQKVTMGYVPLKSQLCSLYTSPETFSSCEILGIFLDLAMFGVFHCLLEKSVVRRVN